MAFGHIRSNLFSSSGSSPQYADTGGANSIGDTYVLMFRMASSVTVTGVTTLSGSNTWRVDGPYGTGTYSIWVATCVNNKTEGGTSYAAVAFSGGTSALQGVFGQFSGGPDPILFDQVNGGNGTSATPSITLTSVPANSLVCGLLQSANDPTVGGAFTQGAENNYGEYLNFEYLLDSGSAGDITVDWTQSSGAYNVAAVSLKLTSGGGATGHPTMDRWGGIPGMVPGGQKFGRGW